MKLGLHGGAHIKVDLFNNDKKNSDANNNHRKLEVRAMSVLFVLRSEVRKLITQLRLAFTHDKTYGVLVTIVAVAILRFIARKINHNAAIDRFMRTTLVRELESIRRTTSLPDLADFERRSSIKKKGKVRDEKEKEKERGGIGMRGGGPWIKVSEKIVMSTKTKGNMGVREKGDLLMHKSKSCGFALSKRGRTSRPEAGETAETQCSHNDSNNNNNNNNNNNDNNSKYNNNHGSDDEKMTGGIQITEYDALSPATATTIRASTSEQRLSQLLQEVDTSLCPLCFSRCSSHTSLTSLGQNGELEDEDGGEEAHEELGLGRRFGAKEQMNEIEETKMIKPQGKTIPWSEKCLCLFSSASTSQSPSPSPVPSSSSSSSSVDTAREHDENDCNNGTLHHHHHHHHHHHQGGCDHSTCVICRDEKTTWQTTARRLLGVVGVTAGTIVF